MQTAADFRLERQKRFGEAALSAITTLVGKPRRADGIDVSHYQGYIDWRAVKDAGVFWVAYKVTQGKTFLDQYFARNRAQTNETGFTYRGLYHWLNPAPLAYRLVPALRKADAAKQAEYFLRIIGDLRVGEFVMLDAEQDGITEDQVVAWCETVEAATGRPVAVYTGVYVAKGTIWKSTAVFNGKRPRVLAAYTSEAKAAAIAAPHKWDAWQWTGSGTMAGVSTLVDLDQIDNPAAFDAPAGITDHLTQESLMYVLISVRGAGAKFIGTRDANGLIFEVRWTGPGNDPDVQARLAMMKAKGSPEETMDMAGLKLASLVGPLPYGDTQYDWTGHEFFEVVS